MTIGRLRDDAYWPAYSSTETFVAEESDCLINKYDCSGPGSGLQPAVVPSVSPLGIRWLTLPVLK
eukprot:3544423-Rhodomonas_salina.1